MAGVLLSGIMLVTYRGYEGTWTNIEADMEKLRYGDKTYRLRKWISQARYELKAGWPEEVYHRTLFEMLRDDDIPVLFKPRKTISHRSIDVHTFECDLLVWDLIVLELKVLLTSGFAPVHMTQLINYLKCWQKDLGLLINFGPSSPAIQRILWDEKSVTHVENYEQIKSGLSQADRETVLRIREVLLRLGQQYGLGYPSTMFRRIFAVEAEASGLKCKTDVEIPAIWKSRTIGQYDSKYILIEERFLINIYALLMYPDKIEFARMKTYLNALGLGIGFIVNFGKEELQIYGVNHR